MQPIFIQGNVPSSKNGRVWTGRALIASKLVRDYEYNTLNAWIKQRPVFHKMLSGKEKPYRIAFKFVRNSRRRFDYINPLQTIQDLMVRHDWLEDDCATEMLPVLLPFEYDKDNSGVYIHCL